MEAVKRVHGKTETKIQHLKLKPQKYLVKWARINLNGFKFNYN